MGHLDGAVMAKINNAIAVSFGLGVMPDGYEGAAVATQNNGAAVAVRDASQERPDNGLLG
jgi:hypothetical protein